MREILGLDCAADNAQALQQLRDRVRPAAGEKSIGFVHGDFSAGLPHWERGRFDGVVSGLAIQYAESYSAKRRCWTTAAYDRLLIDIHGLLRAGGSFVFSVNVPEPSWAKVALYSLWGVLAARQTVRYVENAFRMWQYGCWLKREARSGRFHYLPLETVMRKLRAAGFTAIEHRLTFAGQAYLIRCRKPVATVAAPRRPGLVQRRDSQHARHSVINGDRPAASFSASQRASSPRELFSLKVDLFPMGWSPPPVPCASAAAGRGPC